MYSVAIRDLKNNPTNMTKHLENGNSVFVTKHGKPLGITIPFSEEMLSMGILKSVALEEYKQGIISVGKMAEIMQIDKPQAIKLLNDLNIDCLDYTKEEIDAQMSLLDRL